MSVSTIAALKALSTAEGATVLTEAGKQGLFIWTLGNFAGRADDVNVVAADGVPLTTGAWARQKADGITGAARAIYPQRLPGETDDTLAFRRWVAADGYHCLQAERDASNPYILNPLSPEDVIVPLTRGFVIEGKDAVVKIKDGSGGYLSIFGQKNDDTADLSGVNIRNVDFDHNIQNCPAPDILMGLLVSSRATLAVKNANGGWFTDNIVRNFISTNTVAFNGDGRTSDCHVDRNQFFVGTPVGNAYQDHSTIYLTGDNITVDDNLFKSPFGSSASVCAIELHPGTGYSCQRNRIIGYHTGINVAGVYEFDSVSGIVANNNIDCLRRGIAIYSDRYETHTSGLGIDQLLIDANMIRIRNATPKGFMSGGGPGSFGILRISGARLGTRGIHITSSNVITFDLESTAADWDSIPVGVGTAESDGVGADSMDEDFTVDSPKIINCPGIAVIMGIGGGVLKNCRVGNPEIIRPGSAGSTAFNGAYRAAVWVSPKAYQGSFRVGTPIIVDDLPVTRMTRAIVIGGTTNSTAVSSAFGFDLTVTGDRAVFFATVVKDNNAIYPRITGEQNFPFVAPAALVLSNCRVTDRVSDVTYRTLAIGSAWSRKLRGSGTPVGVYEDNAEYTNDAAAAGQVSKYISKGGVWKPLATIGA